jgi:hypothetical protein
MDKIVCRGQYSLPAFVFQDLLDILDTLFLKH